MNTETPASRLTGLETSLVKISRTDFGVDVAARQYRFHAAADRGFVVPVETLAVMKHSALRRTGPRVARLNLFATTPCVI